MRRTARDEGQWGGGSSPCTQPSAATLGARVVVAEVDESH